MMRTSTRVFPLLGLSAAVLLGMSGAASAGSGTGDSGTRVPAVFSGWEDPNYSGDRWVHVSPANCGSCEIDGWDGDNELSSVINNTTCTVRLYANDSWGGRSVDISAGARVANLETIGFDNDAESLRFYC